MAYLSRAAAAAYLKSNFGHGSASWLSRLQSEGRGPRIFRFNNKSVCYDEADLHAWAEQRIRPVEISSPAARDSEQNTPPVKRVHEQSAESRTFPSPSADESVARAFTAMRALGL